MIRLVDVHKSYENGTSALKGVSLKIDNGEFVFLVGPSGSGKSTIMKLLTAELKPTEGSVYINDFNVGALRQKDVHKLRRTLGVVFQDFRLIEKKTVYENVALALRAVSTPKNQIRTRVRYVLELVGLWLKARRKPHELAGGEQQRVAIARALVTNPSIIIADEPTGNLDPARSIELMQLFKTINELGTTVLIVTHAHELVDKFGERVIAIERGRIVSDKDTGGYYINEELRL